MHIPPPTKLQKGQDYIETKPAIHIGFLNYTLFPERPELLEATKTLYQYNNEETVIWECWAREDYEKKMNSIRRDKMLYEQKMAEQEAELEEQKSTIAEQEAELAELDATIEELKATIEALKQQLDGTTI